MQTQGQDSQSFDMNEMSLREHLLAAQAAGQAQVQQQPTTPDHMRQIPPHGTPHDHNIDPAIAPPGYPTLSPGESGRETSPDGKRGAKRELSQSKRAAQNRAAQRAFRQRKEGYIKKLEEQVRDFHALEESYKQVEAENYSLRDYVINLQSRLIERDGEYPQPPPSIDLQKPRDPLIPHMSAPSAPMAQSAVSQLQLAAKQAQEQEDAADSEQNRDYREDSVPFGDRSLSQTASPIRTNDIEAQSRADDILSLRSEQTRHRNEPYDSKEEIMLDAVAAYFNSRKALK